MFRLLACSLSLLIAAVVPVTVTASDAAIEPEKQDVFVAGQDGVALYRIPGIVVTQKGTILAYCEARRDGRSDWGEIEVHLKRSVDGGKTWSPARHIAHHGERIAGHTGDAQVDAQQTVNNPVAIVDTSTGAIQFLYCVNYARCFSIESVDDGLTWSAPREITATFEPFRKHVDWKVLATGPGHGIALRSGRLVVPVWLAYGKGRDHHPSITATIFSDDRGKTWQAGDVAIPNHVKAGLSGKLDAGNQLIEIKDPNETMLAQLSDDRVLLVTRNESKASRKVLISSPDGAGNWDLPAFHEQLWEPICMASILSVPGRPSTLVFSNPHSLGRDKSGNEIPGGRGKRENLSLKISHDDGKSWSAGRTLESGPSAYSDLAMLPDGSLLCFYEADSRLKLAKLPLEWLR